jgi:DNA-binding NtrC family response regulator
MNKQCAVKHCGLLVVDDDPEMASALAKLLGRFGNPVFTAGSGAQALEILDREPCICLAMVDLVMPGMDGLAFLRRVRSIYPELAVFLMSGFATVESAVQAMREGAEDYLTKPFEAEAVLRKVGRLLELFELKEKVAALEIPSETPWDAILGNSAAIRVVRERAKAASQAEVPVLIVGETGTGKELLARCIHAASRRACASFVPVNCGALPRELVESELFGFRRGAFTGAYADTPGVFAAATGGTVFLDEIGEMPREMQVKLLRILQEGELRPVGSPKPVRVDVRVVAASNQPLQALKSEHLREDLYFRIATVVIELPPLRSRHEDILLLTQHLAGVLGRRYGRRILLDRSALDMLIHYPFPGNVRELQNVLESAAALSSEDPQTITGKELQLLLDGRPYSSEQTEGAGILSIKQIERSAIEHALAICQGNHTRAAALLGISRDTLYRKLRHFQVSA